MRYIIYALLAVWGIFVIGFFSLLYLHSPEDRPLTEEEIEDYLENMERLMAEKAREDGKHSKVPKKIL